MRRKSGCDFSSFLRGGAGLSKQGRAYKLVTVMTAKWVLKRKRAFDTNNVKLRRLPGFDSRYIRSLVGECLSAWESPENPGHAFFPDEMGKICPQLHTRVIKYWKGW